MNIISEKQIKGFERFYRANLINCISGYKPAVLIGSMDADGNTNLAMFSSIIHLGADPALIGFIQRPLGKSGDTYRNIKATACYTMNHVTASIVERAHFTSARFEAGVSEFEACHLEPEYIADFKAPFVKESQLKIGLKFVEEIPIQRNNTRMVIGEIKCIVLPDNCPEENGNISLGDYDTIASSGLENYNRGQHLIQLPYAQVENLPDFSAK